LLTQNEDFRQRITGKANVKVIVLQFLRRSLRLRSPTMSAGVGKLSPLKAVSIVGRIKSARLGTVQK